MGSFFRSMGPGTIPDFATSCTLESGTVGPGDVLYVPAGANTCNIGLRWPVFAREIASPNISLSFQRRRDELERAAQMTDKSATKTAIEQEVTVLDCVIEPTSTLAALLANFPECSLTMGTSFVWTRSRGDVRCF